MKANAARITEQYVNERVSIRDCLRKGLINYSSLARKICEDRQLDSFDAVLMACRRYAGRMRREVVREDEIRALLKRARITVRNHIGVAIIEKPRDGEKLYRLQKEAGDSDRPFSLVVGEEVVTVVTVQESLAKIRAAFPGQIKQSRSGLVQISMLFDVRIEITPGVVSYVYARLADANVNVLEEMSCWTDLMFVIEERDLGSATALLSFQSQTGSN